MALLQRQGSFRVKNQQQERVINIPTFHLEASTIPIAFRPIRSQDLINQ